LTLGVIFRYRRLIPAGTQVVSLHTKVGGYVYGRGIVQCSVPAYRGSQRACQINRALQVLTMTYHTSRSHQAVFCALLFAGMLSGACSWIPKGEAQFDAGIRDRGVASWYGEQFHGRQAANGEIFDMDALTAAHRTMPLGSIIRVVNLANGKYLHVRITDRGPYVNGRILDLSRGAAVLLGMEREGTTHVQIEIVGQRRPQSLRYSEVISKRDSSVLNENTMADSQMPLMTPWLRVLPTDAWLSRRIRRVPAMLAADHTAFAEIATLALT
jgi:rare lipoprotein A